MTEAMDSIACAQVVQLLTDYLDGALAPSVRSDVDAHLAECDGCRIYLEQLRLTASAVGAVSPDPIPAATMDSLLDIYRRVVGRAG